MAWCYAINLFMTTVSINDMHGMEVLSTIYIVIIKMHTSYKRTDGHKKMTCRQTDTILQSHTATNTNDQPTLTSKNGEKRGKQRTKKGRRKKGRK